MISPSFPPYLCGIGDYVGELRQQLSAAGMRVSILTSAPDRQQPDVHARMPRDWTLANMGMVLSEIERIQPDIVHFQYPAAGYRHGVVAALPALIKRKFPQLKLCITFQELHRERWRSRLEGFATAQVVDAVVFSMHYDRLYFRSRVGKLRAWDTGIPLVCAPIPPTVPFAPRLDRATARASLNLQDDDILLTFFGFVRPDKGVDVLLQVFEALVEQYPQVHLALYADFTDAHRVNHATLRYRRRLLPVVERLARTTGRLHHEGYLADPAMLSAALLASDIGVLPFPDGVYETSTVLMAMFSHNVPVVSTPGETAPPDLNKAVELARTSKVDDISRAVARLIEQPVLRRHRQSAARQWLHQNGWPEVVRQHQLLYAKLLAPAPAVPPLS